MVFSTFELAIYPSYLSLESILVLLELLLHKISSSPSTTESWPLNDPENSLIVGILSKRVLYVFDFSVSMYIPVIGSQAYVFPFERDQILLVNPFLLKGFVSYNT